MTTHNFGAIYRVLYDFLFLIAKEERLKWLNWWVRFCARRFVFLLPSVGLTFENLCVDVFHYYRDYTTQKKSERTSFMSADLMDGFICPPLMLLLLFSMFSYCLWWFLMRARRFFCDVGWFFTAWKKWTTTTRDDIARKKSKTVMWRNTRTENKIYTAIQVNKKLYYHERINRVFSLSLSLSLFLPLNPANGYTLYMRCHQSSLCPLALSLPINCLYPNHSKSPGHFESGSGNSFGYLYASS